MRLTEIDAIAVRAKTAIESWNNYKKQYEYRGTPVTINEFKKWVDSVFKGNGRELNSAVSLSWPTSLKDREIANFISKALSYHFSGELWEITPPPPPTPTARKLGSYPDPTTDVPVEISGVSYAFDATRGQWKDDKGNYYPKDSKDEQTLNKAYYDSTRPATVDSLLGSIGSLTPEEMAQLRILLGW